MPLKPLRDHPSALPHAQPLGGKALSLEQAAILAMLTRIEALEAVIRSMAVRIDRLELEAKRGRRGKA